MKQLILTVLLTLSGVIAIAQSCDDMMDLVTKDNYGSTYSSPTSDAISKVTFYSKQIEYQTYYFAVVCFKKEYSYNCTEYLYQVASNTQTNYALHYLDSAGKAFWKYIKPYNDNLQCAPD